MNGERRDDWHNSVDKKIVDLTSAQRTTDDLLEDLDANYAAIDRILRGDPEKETDGLIGRLNHIEDTVQELKRILVVDETGEKGLLHDVRVLKSNREGKWKKWANITTVIVAVFMSGFLGHFWQNIYDYLTKKDTDPLDQTIEKDKRPKGRKIFVRKVHRVEEEGEESR
jgi:hypothetical protein